METPQGVTAEHAARQPCEPPQATFVPLKVEERLMACAKMLPKPVCNQIPLVTS